MAAQHVEVVVFAHTNLGTRLAFNAPLDITASALKRVFEKVHLACLPDTGEIQVNGLMVKRKSCLYYLSDSLPLKYVFPGMKRTWFLHVEVRHLQNLCDSPRVGDKYLELQDLMTCNNENKARCNGNEKKHGTFKHHILKKQKIDKENSPKNFVQNAASGVPEGCSYRFEDKPTDTTNKNQFVIPGNKVENLADSSAMLMQGSPNEVISVSGIIKKYFTGCDGIDNFNRPSISDVTSRVVHTEIEVQSKLRSKPKSRRFSKRQIDSMPKFTLKTPPQKLRAPLDIDLVSNNSRDKSGRSKVGKRLLEASKSLGASVSKNSPTLSFLKYKDGKLLEYKSQIKFSIFSLSDSDD